MKETKDELDKIKDDTSEELKDELDKTKDKLNKTKDDTSEKLYDYHSFNINGKHKDANDIYDSNGLI